MDKREREGRGGGRGAGETRFFVENLLAQSAEKLRRKPFCAVLQKFLVAKNFMDERGESIKIFRRNVFLSHSAESFLRGESLYVSLVSSIETILDERGGRVSRFSVEIFLVSQCRKLC